MTEVSADYNTLQQELESLRSRYQQLQDNLAKWQAQTSERITSLGSERDGYRVRYEVTLEERDNLLAQVAGLEKNNQNLHTEYQNLLIYTRHVEAEYNKQVNSSQSLNLPRWVAGYSQKLGLLLKKGASKKDNQAVFATETAKPDNSSAPVAANENTTSKLNLESSPAEPAGFSSWQSADTLHKREILAAMFLRGEGLEIGALHNPLTVPPEVKVKYVDRLPTTVLYQHYPELQGLPLVEPDILDDGETLVTVADKSQDFVIASHFIEHCQNPILALSNMLRVLKPGGQIFLVVPDKRSTPDVARPLTTPEHLLRDYWEGPQQSKSSHYEEYARLWLYNPGSDPQEVQKRAEELLEKDYSIHFHVWSAASFIEFILLIQQNPGLAFEIDLAFQNSSELVLVLKAVA